MAIVCVSSETEEWQMHRTVPGRRGPRPTKAIAILNILLLLRSVCRPPTKVQRNILRDKINRRGGGGGGGGIDITNLFSDITTTAADEE